MHQIAIYKSTVEKDKVAQYILFLSLIHISEYFGEKERPHQPERHGEDNGKRHEETLVKTGQNQIDQEDTNRIDKDCL